MTALSLALAVPAALFAVLPGEHGVSRAAGVCRGGEALTTSFGEWFDPNAQLSGSSEPSRTASKIVPDLLNPAIAVRLQLEATSPAGQRWTLVLRDPRLRVLSILSEQDFRLANGGTAIQWTGRLEASQVSAELVGGGPGVTIRFAGGMALPKDSHGTNVFSSQVAGSPSWTNPFDNSAAVYRRATEAVGMMVTGLKFPNAQGVIQKETWCCSGAMLTSDIFITNWHCGGPTTLPESLYWNDQVQKNSIIDLGWQEGSAPRRQYAVTQVLQADQRLDYALLRVRPTVGPGAATGRAIPVRINRQLPADNQVFVVHHAECRAKLLSSNCMIESRSYRAWTDPLTRTTGPDITHRCDTEPGASGAPVFDMQGNMIALHHLGFQKADAANQCTSDKLNKAVGLDSILEDVKQKKPALYAELAG
ncbi:serine protease [Sphingomonas sediminicola]